MPGGPSKLAEAFVAVLLPPACREEVLGDLHERYQSPGQYALDALSTVPLVILSRIRRTTSPEMLLIQAFVLYLSFVGAAWWQGGDLPREDEGLARLAMPALVALLGLVLNEAYARPGGRPLPRLTSWLLVGAGMAMMSHSFLHVNGWVLAAGCGIGFPVCSAVRTLLSPPGSLPGFAWRDQKGKERGTGMNLKIVLAIVVAFAVGLAAGVVGNPNHYGGTQFFVKGLPFLLLLALWVVLMIGKMVAKRPR